jgi:hypothetical protein
MVSGALNEDSATVRETTFGVAIAGFGRGGLSFEQAEAATKAIHRHPKATYFTDNLLRYDTIA